MKQIFPDFSHTSPEKKNKNIKKPLIFRYAYSYLCYSDTHQKPKRKINNKVCRTQNFQLTYGQTTDIHVLWIHPVLCNSKQRVKSVPILPNKLELPALIKT